MHKHARAILPKSSDGELHGGSQLSKRKQPKSRNGCVTCKAKRIKCDETKPSCQQCARRSTSCGGYSKSIRWKAFGEPRVAISHMETPFQSPDKHSDAPPHSLLVDGSDCVAAFPAQRLHKNAPSTLPPSRSRSSTADSALLPEFSSSTLPLPAQVGTAESSIAASSSMCISDSSIYGSVETHFANTLPCLSFSCKPSPKLLDLDLLLLEAGLNETLHDTHSPQLSHSPTPENDQVLLTQNGNSGDTYDPSIIGEPHTLALPSEALLEESLEEIAMRLQQFEPARKASSISLASLSRLPTSSNGPDRDPFYQQPRFHPDSPEMIALLFDRRTCSILCIKDDPKSNPWRTHIWSLAKDTPALYHAIAAMTCLHMGRIRPRLRLQGLGHMQCSMDALVANMDDGSMRLDASLAALLALGFAETWDYQRSSTGMNYIKAAKLLVQRAVSQENMSQLSTADSTLLSFLVNTWIYMDVIARLTSVDSDLSTDFEIMTACRLLEFAPQEDPIDPLMGCAVTLFPTIGRVADLINRVRSRITKRNSPAIISEAAELKEAIESWIPLIDSDSMDDSIPNYADSVQTAEAYRWATLLLLRQAVPEIPSLDSFWDLAQRVLIYLATVPLTSRTTIVQIFPLLVAGCEAHEIEDRDWVRQRWRLMSRRMITGIVDRCQEITTEVWRRKDEYEVAHRTRNHSSATLQPSATISSHASFHTSANTSMDHANLCASQTLLESALLGEINDYNPHQHEMQRRALSRTSSFPDSAAFKKGADTLTRAGNIAYTVKGKLHWLVVMREWKWEVMLG